MIKPLGPSETGVPKIIAPALPGDIVVPATTTLPLGATWTAWPPTSGKVEADAAVGTTNVDVPIIKPSAPSETAVPATVAADPPCDSVVPPTITSPCGSTWTCWPPIDGKVGAMAGVEDRIANVDVPMTKPLPPSEASVPDIVTPEPPCESVVPAAITRPSDATSIWWPLKEGVSEGMFAKAGRLVPIPA